MVKQKSKSKKIRSGGRESDNAYILKIVLYLIIGSQWIRLTDAELSQQIPLPLGLVIGFIFATHDHFQIDRKIEYAVIVLACLVGFWTQVGISVTLLASLV